MRLKIFGKLVSLILVLTLAAAGAIGFMLLYNMEQNEKRQATREITRQAENLTKQIEDMIQDKIDLGSMMSGHPATVRGDGGGITELIGSIQKLDAGYESIFVVDRAGKLTHIAPHTPALIGVQFGDRQYYKDVQASGKPAISEVIISRNTKKPIFVIATPVKDAAGNFSGIVGQTITLDALEAMRTRVKVGDTGYAAVTTNPGGGKSIAIAHPNKELVAEQKDVANIEVIKASLGGQKQMLAFAGMNGVDLLGATDFVSQTKWIVTVMVPEAEVFRQVRENRIRVIGMMAGVFVIVALVTWWFTRRMVAPLRTMVTRVEKVAGGDLRDDGKAVVSGDEVGQLYTALLTMTDTLRGMVGQVSRSAEQVAASSQEMTTSAEQLAQGANQVAQSMTEVAMGSENQTLALGKTAQVVDMVSARVDQATRDADGAAVLAARTASAAQEGSKAVETAIIQMGNIEQKVAASATAITKLGERSQEIGIIVDTIAGIAGQTNLLALNAAIEAARAGEQGRGFAVVAEEVRKLAEQSEEAAKQIAALIREIQTETDQAVVAMQEGTREVAVGSDVVKTANQTFADIVGLVEQVSEQIKQMAAAVREIGSGSHQLVQSVHEVGQISKETAAHTQSVSAVTQEQSASTQQIAASSENLSKLATELQSFMARFKV